MIQNSIKKMLSVLLCMVLIAAMALSLAACGSKEEPVAASGSISYTVITVDLEGKETKFEITTDKTITVEVTANEKTVVFTVKTDADTVGAALLEHNLIAGDQGDYGLYVKTVNGITLDWDKDAKYWAFYIGEEYATTGVDMTDAEAGVTYILKPEG